MAIAKKTTPAGAAGPSRVSFNPDTATTGMLDDVDLEITDAATVMFDYNGQQDAQPALCLELTDINGGRHEQYWTCGKAIDWAPTDDQGGFVPLTGKSGFNDSTNIMHLFKSLHEQGGEAILDILNAGDCKQFIGMKAHFIIKTLPKRTGLIRTGKNAEKDPQVLVVSKIHSLPGTTGTGTGATTAPAKAAGKAGTGGGPSPATSKAAGGKANGAVASTSAAAAAAGDNEAVDTELVPAVLASLSENGELQKKDLIKIANDTFNTPELKALRNKAIGRANQPSFMAKLGDNGVTVDGAKLTLSE